MKVCTKCNQSKDASSFFVRDKKTGRLHAQCKACYRDHRKSYSAEHYSKYGEAYRRRARDQRIRLRQIYRENMLAYLSDKKCELCGESDIRTLEFDHLDPKTKLFNISQAVRLNYSWDDVLEEIDKCRILCANCHKKHTAEQTGWYKFEKMEARTRVELV